MSGETSSVDILAVLDQAIQREVDAGQPCVAQVAARDAAAALIAFVENIATPCSEPLNSAVGCRNKDDRRHFMGKLRSAAIALIDRVDGAA